MKINKKWRLLALSLATLGLIATPIIVATSCSSNDGGGSQTPDQGGGSTANQQITKEIIDTNQKFVTNQDKYLDSNGYINLNAATTTLNQNDVSTQAETDNGAIPPQVPAPAEETKLASVLKALSTNALNASDELTNLKNKHFADLSTDQIIWLDSYIFKWNNIVKNLQSGTIFLGANPISGSQVLSSSSNHILDMIKASFNIYQINPETGDPGTNVDQELLSTVKQRISDCTNTLNTYLQVLTIGKKYGIQPSTIAKKMFLNQMMKAFYLDNLKSFASEASSNAGKTIGALITSYKDKNNYFKNIATSISNASEKKVDVFTEMTNLENALDAFITYYSGEYYNNGYGPKVESLPNGITLTRGESSPGPEKERTIIVTVGDGDLKKDVPIYGLGLTQTDLDAPNVGIGFMTITKANMGDLAPFAQIDGNSIYQQLLNNNNSINISAVEIMNKGIELTKKGIDNMGTIAGLVPEVLVNKTFPNQIYYDEDGLGPKAPSNIKLEVTNTNKVTNTNEDTVINFQKLNKWLNQEDFYFGREQLSAEELNAYNDKYWNNPTGELANYKETIINQGYETNWKDKTTINGLPTGTVSGNQALAGAVLSLESYINFKSATNNLYDSLFNPYKDYVISPYNYDVREFVGVGLEGPRGSCQFQYNCDPYYSIQKWSVSSLTVHEGKMGHHTQQQYWTEYMNKDGPGYVFTNTAFHEGWAVFSEWLANEASTYGSKLDPNTSMPTDWLNGNGVVPKYDASKIDEQTAIMKELHGGVYYKFANGTDNSPEKLQNAIKLANMLQYYGFLNEAQLRNMRMAIDVAYHHQATTTDAVQDDSLPFGASISEVRAYMTNNSALGIGDIQSESIRYLVMPSQATGYMLGKMIFEDLYKQVEAKLNESKDPNYKLINHPEETKKLFDLMLKNGEIPLEVLQNIVTKEYQLGDGVTTNSSYDWLKKVTSEVPNRVSLNQNNDAAALEQKRGEKYAYTWIKSQLDQMGINESSDTNFPSRTQPAESVSPTQIPYSSMNVYFNPMESAQIQADLKFNGYYTTQFKFDKNNDTHESQNIMVNINGGKDKSGDFKDLYIVSHYDTANPKNDGTNDNSSGLAMNLALIEYLTKNPDITKGLDVDLHFLFAGAEEQGVVGSWAWALQYQLSTLKDQTQIVGMINLDSVAGGDTLYVHSPDTSKTQAGWNTGDLIRTDLNTKSGNKLEIHPQIDPNGFKAGETGDWSDHAPFYKNGIEVAYIEATNFNIKGFDGYDGYSQTINPEFWKKPDGSTVKLIPSFSVDENGNPVILYIPENYDALYSAGASSCNWGKIWHTDLDLFANYEKFFPGRLQSQMSIVFDTLLNYIESFHPNQQPI